MIPRYSRPEMVAVWSPRDALPHLVRDRGLCREAHGRARSHSQGIGEGDLGEGRQGEVRRRAHRRDREDDEARRHRLSHPSRRVHRRRRALRPSGHDELRRARHLPRRPAQARLRHPDRRRRGAACGAEAPRLRAQADPDHRPLPRRPRRADDLRAQARLRPRRVRPRPRPLVAARDEISTCAISGAVGTFANIDPRVEEHVAKSSASRSSRSRPRSSRATGTRRSSPRSGSSPRRSSGSRPKSAICSAPRSWRPRNSSPKARRAPRRCRTSAIRC